MIYLCGIILAVVIVIIGANLRARKIERDGNWHHTGAQMRRYVNGRWEYREMTQAEADEWKDMTAW